MKHDTTHNTQHPEAVSDKAPGSNPRKLGAGTEQAGPVVSPMSEAGSVQYPSGWNTGGTRERTSDVSAEVHRAHLLRAVALFNEELTEKAHALALYDLAVANRLVHHAHEIQKVTDGVLSSPASGGAEGDEASALPGFKPHAFAQLRRDLELTSAALERMRGAYASAVDTAQDTARELEATRRELARLRNEAQVRDVDATCDAQPAAEAPRALVLLMNDPRCGALFLHGAKEMTCCRIKGHSGPHRAATPAATGGAA